MHTLPTAYPPTYDEVSSGASSGSVPRLHCWVLCRWQQVATPFVQYDKLYVVLTRFVPLSPLKLTAFVLTECVKMVAYFVQIQLPNTYLLCCGWRPSPITPRTSNENEDYVLPLISVKCISDSSFQITEFMDCRIPILALR